MASFSGARRAEGIEGGPRYNGAPQQIYPIIVPDPEHGGPEFVPARWGFIPSWSKEAKPKVAPINARWETIRTSGLFRSAYRSYRALLPVDGYFEWQAQEGGKQPYAIAMKDGSPFTLAAIWSRRMVDGVEERTFSIVTCDANAMMREIHDRMPVVIGPEDRARWINPDVDPVELMRPYPSELMTMWPIGKAVGNVRNQEPDLLNPLG